MADFRMPSLGADMERGTLTEWRVAPGDRVHRGDIVAVVDTSKAEIEIEIFQDGVIDELLVEPGTEVPVGAVLAHVRASDGAAAEPSAPSPGAPEPVGAPEPAAASEPAAAPEPAAPEPAAAEPVAAPEPVAAAVSPLVAPAPPLAARVRVSPLARRTAAALGLDPTRLRGTGSHGAVTRADVERAAGARALASTAVAPTPAAPASPTAPPPRPADAAAPPREPSGAADRQAAMRQAIGALMARSKREVPHYYLEQEIDLRAALDWLAERNAQATPAERLIPAALLLAATARAARAVPELNGFFRDGAPVPAEPVHLGVAIALRGGGLVAPALHNADRATLLELMTALSDLTGRARRGVLRASEMSDATITVTNLGDRGADKVHGVVYVPQVALVGFGRIRERPWAADGMIGARPTVAATLAADHRASDGHHGSRLLAEIDRLLQRPEELR